MGWTVQGSNPVWASDLSLLQNVQTGPGAHPSMYSVGSFAGLKRPECEVNHSPLSSAKLKNE
jgi:hypothetical protein